MFWLVTLDGSNGSRVGCCRVIGICLPVLAGAAPSQIAEHGSRQVTGREGRHPLGCLLYSAYPSCLLLHRSSDTETPTPTPTTGTVLPVWPFVTVSFFLPTSLIPDDKLLFAGFNAAPAPLRST